MRRLLTGKAAMRVAATSLAYDKGIRILAASQANDVAHEDARLGQGLLTFAGGSG